MLEYTNETFLKMRNQLKEQFDINMNSEDYLFEIDIDSDELYELYLDSFPDEIKGIYRERAWHDCSVCKHFLRIMGNVVKINENYELTTLFSFIPIKEYEQVFEILNAYIIDKGQVKNVFYNPQSKVGVNENFEKLDDGSILKHYHFYLELNPQFVRNGKDINKLVSDAKTNKEMLEKSMESISFDSLETVLELIESNSLYRGEVWLNNLKIFKDYKKEYEELPVHKKDNFLWIKSCKSPHLAHLKNNSMGVLLIDITEGMDLTQAVNKYETIVAPTNYQRPKPIFTKKMVEESQAKLEELGYVGSINRRYAKLEDLNINNILFANRNITPKLGGSKDLFDELKDDAITKPKQFSKMQEIGLQEFIDDILPNCQEISLYLPYNLCNNFVSLIAPVDKDSPSMFKWDNSFSWAYRNNLADSMKQQVKKMGGDVDVDLRFSIRWNDKESIWDKNDLDAHCILPNGLPKIYYSHKRCNFTGGWLDVDVMHPERDKPAVENIRFKHRKDMIDGDYIFGVHQFSYRGGDTGFDAEIEFDGKIYPFSYPFKLNQNEFVEVAMVHLEDNEFSIVNSLIPSTNQKIWGLTIEEFIPVSLICYSPNYWGDNNVGNKHIFFMLDGCKNDGRPNAWFNEYLNRDLYEHRRVMEALGHKARVEETDNQLSGVGFSISRRNNVVLKVKTENVERIWKVNI